MMQSKTSALLVDVGLFVAIAAVISFAYMFGARALGFSGAFISAHLPIANAVAVGCAAVVSAMSRRRREHMRA